MNNATRRLSGPSGRTRSRTERQKAGEVQVTAWLATVSDQADLSLVTSHHGTQAEAIRASIRTEAERIRKSSEG